MATETTATGSRQRVKVIVAKDVLSASVLIRKPATDEPPVTSDEIVAELNREGVIEGIDYEVIRKVLENGQYNSPVRVASGMLPEKGVNASFVYHFDTSDTHHPKEAADGRIDYHDISFIQNTTAGAVLVTKKPASHGAPGRTITGKEIDGPPGRDIPISGGTNTQVSADGLTLTAAANGVIQFQQGKVSVMDVVIIRSDVDFSTGNINCSGSVKVMGDIKAGFELKIAGDLEVAGNVEDSTVLCDGNIFIKGGFFGNGTGLLKAGGDITVKFAEGQKMDSGHNITVGGEIINCHVVAKEKVQIKGKKGKIVGGDVRAGREIRASVIGSEAGTKTLVWTAYDAVLAAQHAETTREMHRLAEDGNRVKDALVSLFKLDMVGKLPPEKKAVLKKLEQFKTELPENLRNLEARRTEIEAEIKKLHDARIIAEEIIYPGVRAQFGMVYRDILEETKRCKLTTEGNLVVASDFRGD